MRQGRERRLARAWWIGGLALGLAGSMASLVACGQEQLPEGSQQVEELAEVGDCLGPDAGRQGSYRARGCDDPEATHEIVEMVTDIGPGNPPLCPPGTDEVVDAEQGHVVDGDIASLPQKWCLRSLEPPHPGDPGVGGGELVEQDCLVVDAGGTIGEVACDGSGPAPPQHRLVGIADTVDGCPPGTVEPIELDTFPTQFLCAGPV
jgi:hypothetical protein